MHPTYRECRILLQIWVLDMVYSGVGQLLNVICGARGMVAVSALIKLVVHYPVFLNYSYWATIC